MGNKLGPRSLICCIRRHVLASVFKLCTEPLCIFLLAACALASRRKHKRKGAFFVVFLLAIYAYINLCASASGKPIFFSHALCDMRATLAEFENGACFVQ